VKNVSGYPQNDLKRGRRWDINRFIHRQFESFPRFFAEKRYKLINFAPKKGIVDKAAERLRMRNIK